VAGRRRAGPPRRPHRLAAGFACAAAPIFLLREGRAASYFARASDHSLLAEIRYMHSAMPAFAAAADSMAAPWFKEDPFRHHDLPGKTRLGWILGLPVAAALALSLLRPRDEFSAYLLSQAGAALAGSVAGGHAGVPNGYRFGYLSSVTAVAAAGGVLCLVALLPATRRRTGAIVAAGLLAVSGALGARDALVRWPERQETFDGFHGQDTLIARAALRWERYGTVEVAPDIGHSEITIGGIRRYRFDPDLAGRSLRSAAVGTSSAPPALPADATRAESAWSAPATPGEETGCRHGRRADRSGTLKTGIRSVFRLSTSGAPRHLRCRPREDSSPVERQGRISIIPRSSQIPIVRRGGR
jgi:hypothetical protein